MANNFTPLPAFNNKVDLTVAYLWTENQIFTEFLDKVVADPGGYGVPQQNQASLRPLRDYIYNLRRTAVPNGPQLLRNGNNVSPVPNTGYGWNVNNIRQQYFILFDFLGIFLSLLGPAPDGIGSATDPGQLTTRYCLPLVAVYSQWCDKLGIRNAKPTVVQVTWAYKTDERRWYTFLGASRGGAPPGRAFTNLKENAGVTRFNYLQAILNGSGWIWGDSPVIEANLNNPNRRPGSGQNFGNCGETYPFLYILGDDNLKNSGYGIAINIARASQISPYNGQSFWVPAAGQTVKNLPVMPPCLNCRELVGRYVFPECRRRKGDPETAECQRKIDARLRNFHLWDTT